MRAFSLYFDVLPVIVVNGADWPRGRLFSLLHEYAHLLLYTEGLCDLVGDTRSTTPDAQIEIRCNALAAGMLMPRDLVLTSPVVKQHAPSSTAWTYPTLTEAAGPFGVSAEAFLRRLATLGLVSVDFYRDRREDFLTAYEAEQDRDRPGGGNYYRTKARDLGKGYVRLVTDARRRRVIDSYTAAAFLDVKVGQIDALAASATLGSDA